MKVYCKNCSKLTYGKDTDGAKIPQCCFKKEKYDTWLKQKESTTYEIPYIKNRNNDCLDFLHKDQTCWCGEKLVGGETIINTKRGFPIRLNVVCNFGHILTDDGNINAYLFSKRIK